MTFSAEHEAESASVEPCWNPNAVYAQAVGCGCSMCRAFPDHPHAVCDSPEKAVAEAERLNQATLESGEMVEYFAGDPTIAPVIP